MSLAIPLPRASAQAPVDPKAHWITPEEQLKLISSAVTQEVVKVSGLIPDLANMVAQYAVDSSLGDWHTAHSRLKSRPEKIPPLPRHIHQIMDSRCPIYGDQMQADGTYLKVKDTHFLSLVPKEFGTLNQLERDILKPYGKQEYLNQENPLQIRYFWNDARQEHADVPFPETHWVLMTKDVLPGSRNKTWADQVALVDDLSQKALANYEVPTLQQGFAAITTDMVATGKRRY